jgi:hypothetical protein
MEKNIIQKMALATAEIETVAKNLSIEMGKGKSYKAVSEGDVLRAVKPIEEKYGIYSYPIARKIVLQEFLTTKGTNYNGDDYEKTSVYVRVETTYRFVNIDDPKDFIDTVSYGDGVDASDKASGKAMTYSDKYALLKGYKIETGDDPDAELSKEITGVGKKPAPTPAPTPAKISKKTELVTLATSLSKIGESPMLETLKGIIAEIGKGKKTVELTEEEAMAVLDKYKTVEGL